MSKEVAQRVCKILNRQYKSGDGLTYCKLYLTDQLFELFDLSSDDQRKMVDRMDKCKSIKQSEALYRMFCRENITVDSN